jgi:hypothetical protein
MKSHILEVFQILKNENRNELLLEKRISFSKSELDDFAIFSGDFNPIHCDSVYANLNGFPERIVYGALVIARIIGSIGIKNVIALRADFINPIFLQKEVEVRICRVGIKQLTVELYSENQVKVKSNFLLIGENTFLENSELAPLQLRNPTIEGNEVFSLLGQISRLVGMHEPGELALIRTITLNRKPITSASIPTPIVSHSRNRFNVFRTSIDAGELLIESFAIERNFKSTSEILQEIKEIFPILEVTTRPRKVWVFGITGTLGLRIGLLSALMGHEVYGVYRSAEVRAQEIEKVSLDFKLNMKLVQNPIFQQTRNRNSMESGQIICYCASPRISTNFGVFDEELWGVYKEVYVEELKLVIDSFSKAQGYFVPSTIYLDTDLPFRNGNAEYCLAKAAQEDLIRSRIEKSKVFMPRIGMFPGRHSQINITSENRVLPVVLREFKEWLQAATQFP